uniref:Uncharacterized protein n=1 Tax=Tanacetum cinerariifolium TaxID=118510 RepID=A0A699IKD7_TANCI|nr:hypothetical protein [Tanacetum cinerariifolium]
MKKKRRNEFVRTPSNNSDEDETKITDKAEGDEEMDYTTSQLYDDVDIRLNEPVDTDKGFVEEEGTDATMTNVQQRNENLKILQVIEDAHVTLFTVPQKTKVPVTSSSHLSDLAAKFLNFSDIPHTDDEIISLIDVHVHHEVPSHKVYSLKKSRKDKDKDEDPIAGSNRGLKKRKTSKDVAPTTEEPEFEVVDSDMPHDQEGNLGPTFRILKGIRTNYAELEYDSEECYKSPSKKLDWENPEGGDYPFDLTKPLPLVKIGNHQMVPVDYFFNNNLKYLQGGILTMTYMTSLTKTKVAQYDLPGIKDMVPNI